MQAWVLDAPGSLDGLRLTDLQRPVPSPDQVLVRVRAVALNPADLAVIADKRIARYLRDRTFPLTPGFDFSGVIARVGDEVSEYRVGEEVFGFLPYDRRTNRGTLAEFVNVFPVEMRRKPGNLSFSEAAASATVGTTAVHALEITGQLRAGRRILINGGSGGVGSFAVQIAAAHDAEVWAACSAANIEFVRRLGAQRVFDYRTTDARRLNRRFHAVIDVADTLSYGRMERGLHSGGVYVAVLPSVRFVYGVLSSAMSSRSCRMARATHAPDVWQNLIRLLSSRRVKAQIHVSYTMVDAKSAFELLRDESVRGKVVVVVSNY